MTALYIHPGQHAGHHHTGSEHDTQYTTTASQTMLPELTSTKKLKLKARPADYQNTGRTLTNYHCFEDLGHVFFTFTFN